MGGLSINLQLHGHSILLNEYFLMADIVLTNPLPWQNGARPLCGILLND